MTDARLDAAVEALRDLISASDAYRIQIAAYAGLTITDVHALAMLHRHCPVPQGDLARAVGVTPSGATVLVERLRRAGLARRTTDPDDRRHVLIDLTERGRSLIEESTERIQLVFAGIDPDRLGELTELLARLAGNARQQAAYVGQVIATGVR